MTNCNSEEIINEQYFKDQFATCDGKKSCQMDFTDPSQYIKNYNADGQCGKNSYIFIQSKCLLPDSSGHMDQRQVFGLVTACTAVFIYLFTIVYFDYIKTL